MRLDEAHAGGFLVRNNTEILNILGEQGGGDDTCQYEFVLGGCSDLIFPEVGDLSSQRVVYTRRKLDVVHLSIMTVGDPSRSILTENWRAM